MIGRTFAYRGQQITFSDYIVKGSVYYLSFGEFKIQKDEALMETFIPLLVHNEVLPSPLAPLVAAKAAEEPNRGYVVKTTSGNLEEGVKQGSTKILDVLDEMIEMVKSDPNAIKQAMAINSLCKTKLDTHKTILKIAK